MSLENMINKIRQRAISDGGSYIPYSQCIQPTKALIESMPQTKDGVCAALSAKWIVEHAAGRSLFDWLCTPGTTNVKQSSIANLMINFIDQTEESGKLANRSGKSKKMRSERKRSPLDFQDFMTDKYLQLYGLKRRTGIAGHNGTEVPIGPNAITLNKSFSSKGMNTKGESYMMIAIVGKGGGHALAGYVAGEEVIVFDPNFGEFYFPTNKAAQKWFPYFYTTGGYMSGFTNFWIHGYAKDATGNWKKYK